MASRQVVEEMLSQMRAEFNGIIVQELTQSQDVLRGEMVEGGAVVASLRESLDRLSSRMETTLTSQSR